MQIPEHTQKRLRLYLHAFKVKHQAVVCSLSSLKMASFFFFLKFTLERAVTVHDVSTSSIKKALEIKGNQDDVYFC